MSDKKKGFPKESEIVLCNVTNIQYNSVFVRLEEYNNLQGMIHISEISPGRIRNIRDYVKPGKIIVCKILRINEQRGHIDLSLRRVSESQRREKLEGIKLKQKAEKIVEFTANDIKKDYKQLLPEVESKVLKEFESLYACFEDVVEHDFDISSLGFDKDVSDALEAQIRQKIKPARVYIEGILTIVSYKEDGLEMIKKALIKAEELDTEKIDLYYAGGGHFKLIVDAPEYKIAENVVEDVLKTIKENIDPGTDFKFERKDNKK